MAAESGIASAIVATANPTASAVEPTATDGSARMMKDLVDEINQLKTEIESTAKTLKKLDSSRKKAAANKDAAIEGQNKVRILKERSISLQKEMDTMTKDKDPSSTQKAFDKAKQSQLKTLNSLSHSLQQTEKHLEKVINAAATKQAQPYPTEAQPATTDDGKGIAALIKPTPVSDQKQSTTETEKKRDNDQSGTDDQDDDEDDVVSSHTPKLPERKDSKPVANEVKSDEDVDDDDEDDDDDDDDEDDDDDRQDLARELQRRTTEAADMKTIDHSLARSREPIVSATTPSKTQRPVRTPSPQSAPTRGKVVKSTERDESDEEQSEEDSYFEEDEEDQYDPRSSRDTGVRKSEVANDDDDDDEQPEYDDNDDNDDDQGKTNATVQSLRSTQYLPGTQFRAICDFTGDQSGDLTIRKGDILSLVEQTSGNDWWTFRNVTTRQEGLVPINCIQPMPSERVHHQIKASNAATVLVDAFKANRNIPDGCVASDLASLGELDHYQMQSILIPMTTESNLSLNDLYWRADKNTLRIQEVNYQKILTLKECVKVPKIRGEQVRVLNRCVRVCLYDGTDIVSNIHVIRAYAAANSKKEDTTEDWLFVADNIRTRIDEQPRLLIRANRTRTGQEFKVLFEISQLCESTVTNERCEIGCGWTLIELDDGKPPLLTDTKNFNQDLKGGHIDEPNIPLDQQYLTLQSNGLSGMISRLRRARIKFSLESREGDIDILYDNLPPRSLIIPINMITSVVFFRNELAYQFYKQHHPSILSTMPIDSIFLTTFFKLLSQPDLIDQLGRLYRSRRQRSLKSSASTREQCELFVDTYERFIYPLLFYRLLKPYNFHDGEVLSDRNRIVTEIIQRQLVRRKKTIPQDIVSILLDPTLTENWEPFTTDEICFTMQKYVSNVSKEIPT